MTSLQEMQRKTKLVVQEIEKKYGKTYDTSLTVIHIVEEIGEVARQLYNEKTRRDTLDTDNLAEELADCLLLINHLATLYNIDLGHAFENKFGVLKKQPER